MRRTVTIGGKDIELKATASTMFRYRDMFGRDLIKDFIKLKANVNTNEKEEVLSGEPLEIVSKLTFIMAKQADPSIGNDLYDWLDQFETFSYGFAIEVVSLWAESMNVKIELKNV